jgi:alpha-L-fucosidase
LNVSPRGDGTLPQEQVERLELFSQWMNANGEAVTGTRAGLEAWQFYGPSTRRGETVYLHLLMRPYDTVDVRGVPVKRLRRATHLASGQPLDVRTRTGIIESIMPDPPGTATITVPPELVDDHATVIALEFE